MYLLITGLALFYIIHVTRIAVPGLRDAGIARLGEGGWKGIYSLVSLTGLVMIVLGWMQFRPDAPEIYTPPSWGAHANALIMLVAFIVHFTAYQPTGRIKLFLKHPFVTAFVLWSAGHLLANGDLASLILFGSFLIYSLITRISAGRRVEPALVFEGYRGDIYGIVIGLVVYTVFALWVHGFLFGVSPF